MRGKEGLRVHSCQLPALTSRWEGAHIKQPAHRAAGQLLQLDSYKLLEELGEGRVYEVTMVVPQVSFDKIL